MRKRWLALVMLAALLLGLAATSAAAATPAYYQVGYAKVDVNPYYDENDHSKGLMPVPLRGNSYEEQRLALKEKMDDNGDGKVDDNDGIFATAIAITDQYGNTVILIATDFIGGFGSAVTTPVRAAIMAAHPEITGDKVMIAGSHTHHSVGVTLTGSKTLDPHAKECLNIYVERLKANLVKAAELALADRSPARMYKGQIEANDSKAASGPVGDTINKYRPANNQVTVTQPNAERVYNSVRHYKVTVQDAMRTVTKQSVSPYYYYTFPKNKDKSYKVDTASPKVTYVGGDNFNGVAVKGDSFCKEIFYVDPDGVRIEDESIIQFRGDVLRPFIGNSSKRAYKVPDMKVVSEVDHVSESDDTLLITEFRFDDTAKKPIILLNWRAHTNMNRYVSDDYDTEKWEVGFYTSFFQVSADWINAFRFVLEQEGYRPAFFNGAAGNISGSSRLAEEKAWLNYETETDKTYVKNKGAIYGSELAEVALELLTGSGMKQINTQGGQIRTQQIYYETDRQHIDPGTYLAAIIYQDAYKPASPAGTRTYQITYWEDANGVPLIDKTNRRVKVDQETGKALQDPAGNTYVDENGNPVQGKKKVTGTYAVASIQHANSAISRYGTTAGGTKIELNAILIGTQWAAVTAPGEMFDRYSKEATLETMNQYNDWEKLWGENLGTAFGEPFMLGYCNEGNGYFPSYATYDFSKGVEGYSQGSYETQTTTFAQGTGETVIELFKGMLQNLSGKNPSTKPGYCEYCKKDVDWTPLTEHLDVSCAVCSGHYYVDTKTLETKALSIRGGNRVCIDLKGNTISGGTYVFSVAEGGILNIQDSVGSGKIIGQGSLGGKEYGGTLQIFGEMNLYGGTVTFREVEGYGAQNGGVAYIYGTMRIYGGTITGGVCSWVGGNIYVNHTGTLEMYGGKVTNGRSTTTEVKNVHCIVMRGKMILGGNASADQIRLWPEVSKGSPPLEDCLTFHGFYTGSAELCPETRSAKTDIGNSDNANLLHANLTVTGSSLVPLISGDNVILENKKTAQVINKNGSAYYASSVQAAISLCNEGGTVYVMKECSENLTVPNNIILELNGFNINGTVTVEKGKTLSVRDVYTGDYDISDGIYGKIKKISGTVVGAAATAEQDSYLMVKESNGVSFHAVGLKLTSMSLRPENAGLYYNCTFQGDAKVKAAVSRYGVAMSVKGTPTKDTLFTGGTSYTWFADGFGTGKNTGSILANVLKSGLTTAKNQERAAMQVYGRGYIYTKDGQFIFGYAQQRSFRQQMELADQSYSSLTSAQQTALKSLYKTYSTVMKNWSLTNVKK